jgi:hypothetical protein
MIKRSSLAWLSLVALTACGPAPAPAGCPTVVSEVSEQILQRPLVWYDVVFVVDSAPEAAAFVERLPRLLDSITLKLCVSRSTSNSLAHPCDPNNPDDVQVVVNAESVRIGVISADLGARGSGLPGCDSANGDDGRIAPRLRSPSPLGIRAWPRNASAWQPQGGRSCEELPAFLEFCSNTDGCERVSDRATRDEATLGGQFRCHVAATARGCSLGQPLEALYRALVVHGAALPAESGAPNAGFLRPEAPLWIVMLSSGEDHSVRDCAQDRGFTAAHGDGSCVDGTSAFRPSSSQWASSDVDQRFYRSSLNSPDDPTWNLDRYYDTSGRWPHDLLSLKPRHPERVLFSAIVGAPLAIPRRDDASRSVDYPALQPALEATTDPQCSHVTAACASEGATIDLARRCRGQAPIALPSRRIVELARRFYETGRCNGRPCLASSLESVCAASYTETQQFITMRTAPRLPGRCLTLAEPAVIAVTHESQRVDCRLIVTHADDSPCDARRGERVPTSTEPTGVGELGQRVTRCEVDQLATWTVAAGPRARSPVSDEPGWYFDRVTDPREPWCTRRISYTGGARPDWRSSETLYCITVANRDAGCAD